MTDRQRAVASLENLREQGVQESAITDFIINNWLSGLEARAAMEEAEVELLPFTGFEES
jgi:hypothetical protein